MRSSRVAIVATLLLISHLISISPTVADSKTPAPTSQSSVDLKAAFKIAFDQYRKDFKDYEDLRRKINRIYKEAIEKALADARSARSIDQTQKEKRRSMKAQQDAVVSATLARDAAIEAIGSPPVPPTQPEKVPGGVKSKSSQKEKPAPKK